MEDKKLSERSLSDLTKKEKIYAVIGYTVVALVGVVAYKAGKRKGSRYLYSQ